jgi:sugar (pentulose or hexulose) kinase
VSLLLGLDVGTTAVKAAAFDTSLRELAHGRAPTPWRPVPTGAELDPGELLDAAAAAAREAVAAAGGGQLAGIGVASMAETGVLVDDRGRPVVPSIAWHDARGDPARLARDLPGFPARTGVPASPLCTLVKYRWMRDHWPQAARGMRWLNVAEWIVAGFGGEPATELSLASRTGFYDLHTRRPWDEALAWADAPAALAPEAVPAGTPMGRTEDGAVLTVGGHDHLAAAVGAGAAGEDDLLDDCGTAEAFVRATRPLSPEATGHAVAGGITVAWHAVPGRQALQGGLRSGTALQRILALLGIDPDARDELEAAAAAIERARPAGDGLVLQGVEGKAVAPLTLAGIDHDASPAAAYHAALDAVGRAGADVLARMADVAGPAKRLVVTGGWAAGEAAQAVKARHLGPFELSPGTSQGARGAARAAGCAAGLWSMDDQLQEVT